MRNLIVLSIFLIPLSSVIPIPGTIIWYPQLLALLAIGLSFIALRLWKMNKFISLLMIYETFSYVFVTQQFPRTLICLSCGLAALFIAEAVSRLEDRNIFYKCLIGMAIFQCTYVILQHFNIDFLFHGSNGKADVVGFFGSHNQMGAFFTGVGTLLLNMNPALITLSIVPMFLAKQNTAAIGLLAGTMTYVIFTYNKNISFKVIIFLMVLIVPIGLFSMNKRAEIMERVNVWKLSISQLLSGTAHQLGTKDIMPGVNKVYQANPITGFGLGNFFVISPLTQNGYSFSPYHRYEHAHNDLIEALFELGYIGVFIILLCIGSVCMDFINAYHALAENKRMLVVYFSSLVALSVSSFGIYIFHAPVSLFLFCLILGLFYGEVSLANKSTIDKNS